MKYTPTQYAETLYELLERETDEKNTYRTIQQFVSILKKQRALSSWKQVVQAFERIYYSRKNIIQAHITLARGHLPELVAQSLPKNTEISVSHDISLVGGIQIQIGDTLIDNSVRARVEKLKEALQK